MTSLVVLRVVQPFATYRIGDTIRDSEVIAGILAGEQVRFVVRVTEGL